MQPQPTVLRVSKKATSSAPNILVSNVGVLKGAVEWIQLQRDGEEKGEIVCVSSKQDNNLNTHTD